MHFELMNKLCNNKDLLKIYMHVSFILMQRIKSKNINTKKKEMVKTL